MRVRHRRTRRLLGDRTLEVRKPGIYLPIPLPSVPIISPLLFGNNGNGNGNGGSGGGGSQPPPSPATPPGQTPPTGGGASTTGGSTSSSSSTSSGGATSGGSTGGSTSSGSTGGSTSGGSTGGSTSGSTGGTSSGSTGGTSGGSTGGTTGGGSTGGTISGGSTGGTTSGGSTGGSGSAAVGGSTPGGSSAGGSTPDGSSSPAGSSSPSTAGTSNGGTPSLGTDSTSTGSGSTSDGTPGTVGSGTGSSHGTSPSPSSSSVSSAGGSANAANLPGGASEHKSISAITSTITDGHGHAIATTIITPTVSVNPSSSSVSPANGAAKSGHLSTGGIAAITVILLLFGLGITVILLRKRWVERRHERRDRWWFARRRTSQNNDDNSSVEFARGDSARSSFATTIDQANNPNPNSPLDLSNVIPPVPAMAQIRNNPNAPTLVLQRSHFNPLPFDQRRFSIGSAESHGSADTQFLVVHHRDSLNTETPPSSSRPFLNSESFAFPKPPSEAAGSRPSSSATLAMRSPTQSSTFFPSSRRPSTAPNYPTPPASPIALLTPPSPASGVLDPFSDKNGLIDSDPFADQHPPLVQPNHSSSSSGTFSEIETIRRSFVPTLEDEVGVEPNEQVRILQLFDDGWIKVEKVKSLKSSKDKVKVTEVETGLIPIDCLREPGVDLPTFFDKKRISGYTSPTKSTFGF